ncbi:CinA family nicotinamide mononucleotide deamidase-related protein [Autumnicola edwardsiae]|uniref:CinA-like protein n=1 Tax=Autumnicola edwardsiae TaxID=3075594 RepID=A0ABU3CVC6_9FLAO|nr:CinA family nicotinamide mononucleotide deamidase-related protein [Zunongwangia sp. F297]MDT0650317.1 CinA family nicotinamide mononucleotide deamidase-related protein [Zunongwangia sp. F297]
MTAEIVTIGDEILIGQIVDTNSAHIAQELNKVGIVVHQIISIQDEKEHILQTLRDCAGRANVVIITGGLGPTKDDLTKYCLCEYFDDVLELNEDVLKNVEKIFEKIENAQVSDLNREQAMVPSKAVVLHNKFGTAPGLWLKKDKTVFIAIPGVPFEMKTLMEREIVPRLKKEFHRPFIYHKTIRTYGLGESAIAERIEEWENNLPKGLKLAYLPDLGNVRLRLSGKGENEEELKLSIEKEFEKLHPLIDDIIADSVSEDDNIEETISKLLSSRNQFLSAAESCTGGELAAQFTLNPGASSCFKGSLVSYATQAKKEILNIPAELIEKYSVVSAEVAEKMATNAKEMFKSHYAIGTTGNAGPTKGESDADVGTVFIALATPNGVYSKKFVFGNSREQVVKKTVNKAFELILRELTKL